MSPEPLYQRVLLKLSGEALMGSENYGVDPVFISRVANEIRQLIEQRVQVSVVIGGGNIFRGAGLAAEGMDRVTGDHMGMLATVINGLALQDALEHCGVYCRVMSGLQIHQVCEGYVRRRAIRHMQKGRVVVLVAGTGNPFFTTDSAAALRAVELGADVLLKATQVDGIYSADPKLDADAVRYEHVTYAEVLQQNLAIMDTTAFVMCRDHDLPIRIFDLHQEGELVRVVSDNAIGSTVSS